MAPCKTSRSVPISFIEALILAAMVWWTKGAVFIPDSFATKDLSAYTIRYLSEDGNDTEACLSNTVHTQDHQANTSTANSTVQYCGSLVYSLTGGKNSQSSNLILLVVPGIYLMGKNGTKIIKHQNIILSKMPDTPGEVVFKCNEYLEEGFNNLFIRNTNNIVLNEIVFTECGPFTSPVNIQNTNNIIVSKCTFR